MIDAMSVVGEKFKNNEIFVPEMLVAARAMKKGVEVLKPSLGGDADVSIGKAVIGTVQGDLHDIGNVPAERFVEAAQDPAVKIVGVSALLTTTMPAMKATVEALNAAPNRADFKVMVGGAPITQEFAEEIGADAYTADAATCASVAKKFVAG